MKFYTLQQLTKGAFNTETYKSNANTMQTKNSIIINRMERVEMGETGGNYAGDMGAHMNYLMLQMEELKEVTRLKKAGELAADTKSRTKKRHALDVPTATEKQEDAQGKEEHVTTVGEMGHSESPPSARRP